MYSAVLHRQNAILQGHSDYGSTRRIGNRIIQHIGEHLFQKPCVSLIMKIRLDILVQFHFLILYPSHDFAAGFLQHPADVQVRAFQLEITATHPGC